MERIRNPKIPPPPPPNLLTSSARDPALVANAASTTRDEILEELGNKELLAAGMWEPLSWLAEVIPCRDRHPNRGGEINKTWMYVIWRYSVLTKLWR